MVRAGETPKKKPARKPSRKEASGLSNRQRTFLVFLVALVWAANMLAPIFIRDFKPEDGVTVAFTAILGVLTAGYKKGEDE